MTDATDLPAHLAPDVAPDAARALAADLQRVIKAMLAAARDDATATDRPVALVTGHLGRPLDDVVVVTAEFPSWDHASAQAGLDAYLAAHHADDGPPTWYGLRGPRHDPPRACSAC